MNFAAGLLNVITTGLMLATVVVQCCPSESKEATAEQEERKSVSVSTPSPEATAEEKKVEFPAPTPTASVTETEDGDLPACVQTNCNCSNFTNQKQAQKILDAFPDDPHGLDRNNDGIACESLPD